MESEPSGVEAPRGDSQGEPDGMLPAKSEHAIDEGHLWPSSRISGGNRAKRESERERDGGAEPGEDGHRSCADRRIFLGFPRTDCIEITRSDHPRTLGNIGPRRIIPTAFELSLKAARIPLRLRFIPSIKTFMLFFPPAPHSGLVQGRGFPPTESRWNRPSTGS